MARNRKTSNGVKIITLALGFVALMLVYTLVDATGFFYRRHIGKDALNAVNGARRGQIVGLEKRSGVWVYRVRTEGDRITFAPVGNTDVR